MLSVLRPMLVIKNSLKIQNGITQNIYLNNIRKQECKIKDIINPSRRHFRSNYRKTQEDFIPNVETGTISLRNLVKPFTFAVLFSAGSLAGAALLQYENMRAKAISSFKKSGLLFQQSQKKVGAWRQHLNQLWGSLTESEKIFVPLFALNAIVFVLWRIPRFQPVMVKYFCSNPAAKTVCWPMILSTFSHYSVFHLCANMFVLYSFSAGVINHMGKEQFLGMYLAGGALSSFTSYFYKAILSQPSLSLGASGAIMAVLGYVCCEYPETRLSILFLPMYTFSAGAAIKVIMGIDLAGIVFGWRFFDHAAHLGGALWGIAWCYWGNQYIWQNREPLLQYWHHFRGNDT